MEMPRRSGLLLHITSLPGGPCTGDLGRSSYDFADFLQEAGQAWWQTLPLNPIGEGNSPYSSIASFATEPLMVSPELLIDDGLLDPDSIKGTATSATAWQSDFESSRRLRATLLREAYAAFVANRSSWADPIAEFEDREKGWLDDYCLFAAFHAHFATSDWTQWPSEIVQREAGALRRARQELHAEIDYLAFEQFLFDRQWKALKRYCNDKGIGVIGDVPMFVSHRSADVWAHQSAFLLDGEGRPSFVAGAPPDAFSADGQLWGNALYDWQVHEETGFAWWTQRIGRQLDLFDVVRLDHFIGFERYWRIPAGSETAMDGSWIPAPGDQLFGALLELHGGLPLIAEDLGSVTQEVWDLRDRFRLPGMKVLQFGFGEGPDNVHRPENYPPASVAYTGTHDSNTTLGWYRTMEGWAESGDPAAEAELREVREYVGTAEDKEITPALVEALFNSPANTVIFPVQDVLNLDGRHRMNTPGTDRDNWTWRLVDGLLDADEARRLRELAGSTGRLQSSSADQERDDGG